MNYSDMLPCVFMFLPLAMILAWGHFQYPRMLISHLLIMRNIRSTICILRLIPDLPKQEIKTYPELSNAILGMLESS